MDYASEPVETTLAKAEVNTAMSNHARQMFIWHDAKKTVKNLLTKSPPVSISCQLAPDRVRPDLSICETPRRHRAGFFKGQHRMSPRFPVKSPIHQLKADLTPNFCAGKRHQELRPSLPRASWNWDWSLDRWRNSQLPPADRKTFLSSPAAAAPGKRVTTWRAKRSLETTEPRVSQVLVIVCADLPIDAEMSWTGNRFKKHATFTSKSSNKALNHCSFTKIQGSNGSNHQFFRIFKAFPPVRVVRWCS